MKVAVSPRAPVAKNNVFSSAAIPVARRHGRPDGDPPSASPCSVLCMKPQAPPVPGRHKRPVRETGTSAVAAAVFGDPTWLRRQATVTCPGGRTRAGIFTGRGIRNGSPDAPTWPRNFPIGVRQSVPGGAREECQIWSSASTISLRVVLHDVVVCVVAALAPTGWAAFSAYPRDRRRSRSFPARCEMAKERRRALATGSSAGTVAPPGRVGGVGQAAVARTPHTGQRAFRL